MKFSLLDVYIHIIYLSLLLLFFIFYRLLMYGNFYLLCILSRITCDTRSYLERFTRLEMTMKGWMLETENVPFPKQSLFRYPWDGTLAV